MTLYLFVYNISIFYSIFCAVDATYFSFNVFLLLNFLLVSIIMFVPIFRSHAFFQFFFKVLHLFIMSLKSVQEHCLDARLRIWETRSGRSNINLL